MLGSRAVRACMSKSSTSAFDFAYSSLARRGAPNRIRMNPRSRCASGMLGSSSTVYNEQPTSADSCLLGHAPKEGTGQIYNNLTKIQHISVSVGLTPTHAGNTIKAHPLRHPPTAHPHALRGTQVGSSQRIDANRLTPAHTGKTAHRQVVPASPPSTFATPAKAPLGGPPPPRRQAARAR